ncbi:MAG TPA: cytochrome c oxidase subunit 3 family protein [Acidobacteriaceae bacterium]
MDSQTIAVRQQEEIAHHEHDHPAYLRHHFETVEQQKEAASFGMWLFLLTEIMFFGGLFMAYLLYRNWYHDAFVSASNTIGIGLGTTNTAVLIVSSFTMAMGVYCAEKRNRRGLLVSLALTLVLGLVFLGIKSVEYHEKYVEHHIPGAGFSIEDFVHPHDKRDIPLSPDVAQHAQIFFFLYFAMTGMHALHMIIGVSILLVLIYRARQGAYTTGHTSTIDNFGLYWHFVDIVWIFLFPLLYLISRHPLH